MQTETIGKGSADEGLKERGGMVGRTWEDISDESFRLSHLVQAGRRVSKDQLLEVDQEVKGPHETADERSKERGEIADRAWEDINDESFKLSHIVQAGRRVSKDQLLEVDQEVKGPHGFLKK